MLCLFVLGAMRFILLSTRVPDLNYKLRCSDLCADFKEDLEFHFSFGITALMVCGCGWGWGWGGWLGW